MTFRPASTASASNGSGTAGESVVGVNPGEMIHEDGIRAILAPPRYPSPTADESSLGSHESQRSTWMGRQGRDVPQACLVDILPPSVPRVPTPSLHPLQEWEGCVTEIRSDEFVADLLDLTAGRPATPSDIGSATESSLDLAPTPRYRLFELRARQARLSNDRPQGARAQLAVVRHWDGYGAGCRGFLHDYVATASSYLGEPVRDENATDLATRKNTQPTQPQPRCGSRRLRSAGVSRFPR